MAENVPLIMQKKNTALSKRYSTRFLNHGQHDGCTGSQYIQFKSSVSHTTSTTNLFRCGKYMYIYVMFWRLQQVYEHVKVEVLLIICAICNMSIATYLSSLSSTGRRRSGTPYLVTWEMHQVSKILGGSINEWYFKNCMLNILSLYVFLPYLDVFFHILHCMF